MAKDNNTKSKTRTITITTDENDDIKVSLIGFGDSENTDLLLDDVNVLLSMLATTFVYYAKAIGLPNDELIKTFKRVLADEDIDKGADK